MKIAQCPICGKRGNVVTEEFIHPPYGITYSVQCDHSANIKNGEVWHRLTVGEFATRLEAVKAWNAMCDNALNTAAKLHPILKSHEHELD